MSPGVAAPKVAPQIEVCSRRTEQQKVLDPVATLVQLETRAAMAPGELCRPASRPALPGRRQLPSRGSRELRYQLTAMKSLAVKEHARLLL